jgi:hypothetical protein
MMPKTGVQFPEGIFLFATISTGLPSPLPNGGWGLFLRGQSDWTVKLTINFIHS